MTALVAVAVTLAVVAIGIAGWIYYQTVTEQRDAVERLERATADVERAEAAVLALDEVVRADVASLTTTRVAEVASQMPTATTDLDEAIALIDGSVEMLPDEEVAYARALRDSAEARREMLQHAGPILEASEKAAAAYGPAMRAWESMREAKELSRQAVAEYNKLTRESVTRSAQLTRQANAKITEARTRLDEAAAAFPEVDLSMYRAYSDEKLAALLLAKQADEAFLAGRLVEANTLGARFNAAERELAAKAATLPASPAAQITAAFDRVAGEAKTAYLEARERATEADDRLRRLEGAGSDAGAS
ncbi:MAG TPA: hypothetical protein VFH17_03235 [Coriobacteriia bacterium]|nr:hypothetical protein [Coriobacteriia bacterium]